MGVTENEPSVWAGRELTTAQWARAFHDAFAQLDKRSLDGCTLLRSVALDDLRIAVVYDDGTGRVTGRIYRVDDLNGSNRHSHGPVTTVTGFILGEIVEPSGPGLIDHDPLLEELNQQFPSMGWWGDLPRFDGERPR